MRIISNLAAGVALAVATFATNAATFSIEENFDDSSHFTQSGSIPDGWSVSDGCNFYRAEATDFGVFAQSGSYILGAPTGHVGDVIYTPAFSMKGNTPASIEFYAMAPGGTPNFIRNLGWKVYAGTTADISTMTLIGTTEPGALTDWTYQAFSFTPEADGNYFYAIEITQGQMAGGGVQFDSFLFEGTEAEVSGSDLSVLEPNEDNLAECMELPYMENFSNPSHYDGSSNMPVNWVSVGTHPFVTANTSGLRGYDGTYYMTTVESTTDRDERAYTPFFNFQAGVEYTVSFYTHFEGTEVSDGVWRYLSMDLTLGTEQDGDFHPVTLGNVSRCLDETNSWVYSEFKFTPVTSGAYCLSFKLNGAPHSGTMSLDNLVILSPQDQPAPVANFYAAGLFELMESNLLAFEGYPVRMMNVSKYGETYTWEADGCTVTELNDGNADIIFPQSGDYEVKLTATNARGSRSSIKTMHVTCINNAEGASSIPLLSYSPQTTTILDRGSIPTIGTDEYDWLTGYNHYYRSYAERFDVAPGVKSTLNSISLFLTDMRYRPMSAESGDQRLCDFNVTVYGADDNGNLDETKVFGSMTKTMKEVFGGTGIGGGFGDTACSISFDQPIVANGPFYIAFTFDDALEVDAVDANLGRSYIGATMVRDANGTSNMYVKPTAVPESATCTADGNWHHISEMNPSFSGLGNCWAVWTNFNDKNTGIAINNSGKTVFAARFDGNDLIVSGTAAGETIALYDLAGRNVLMATGTDNSTVVPTSLPSGIYIVSTNAGSVKVVK